MLNPWYILLYVFGNPFPLIFDVIELINYENLASTDYNNGVSDWNCQNHSSCIYHIISNWRDYIK